MPVFERIRRMWHGPSLPRFGLALAGGGVIGGMYEVGVLAALEEQGLGPARHDFDLYVGCSAGAVVASVMANGVRACELYRILDEDLLDPLNFQRTAVYASDSFRRAVLSFARFVWAVGKHAAMGLRTSIPDMLAHAEGDFPAGFFSLDRLEVYMRETFAARGLSDSFDGLKRTLLIPAVDLGRAERVVFGQGELAGVPVSRAIAASSAIPGFFEPVTINGRDFVDGGVGYSGHADLVAGGGADVVVVVNPLVPSADEEGQRSIVRRGLYFILEQANRIASENVLQQDLAAVAVRYPSTALFLIEPPRTGTPLFGPSMGFGASRDALRYGFTSTKEWLATRGAALARRLGTAA